MICDGLKRRWSVYEVLKYGAVESHNTVLVRTQKIWIDLSARRPMPCATHLFLGVKNWVHNYKLVSF